MRSLIFLGAMATLVVSFGCASSDRSERQDGPAPSRVADAQLERRIHAEPPADTPEEIADRGAYDFVTAPGLTKEQKEKIMAIYTRTYYSAMSIRRDMGQAKSLLFKTVASKDFSSDDVARLKTKIVDLDQKRLQIMFKALEDVQAIVGTGKGKEELYQHFLEYEHLSKK